MEVRRDITEVKYSSHTKNEDGEVEIKAIVKNSVLVEIRVEVQFNNGAYPVFNLKKESIGIPVRYIPPLVEVLEKIYDDAKKD